MTYIPGGGGGGGNVGTSGDVALNNPIDGQVLMYDSSLQKWTNGNGGDAATTKAVVLYNAGTSAYPARPVGYGSVEWIGPVDPGSAAQEFDTWLNTAQA